MLRGITMQLTEFALTREGVPFRQGPITVADLPDYATVFLANSHGIAAVSRVGDTPVKIDEGFLATLLDCYDSTPWDPI
jgi:branched-subunit amino acid aminotransferase/4-amino-4-deoxychorismate lyase